jgi:hypothetical protein
LRGNRDDDSDGCCYRKHEPEWKVVHIEHWRWLTVDEPNSWRMRQGNLHLDPPKVMLRTLMKIVMP